MRRGIQQGWSPRRGVSGYGYQTSQLPRLTWGDVRRAEENRRSLEEYLGEASSDGSVLERTRVTKLHTAMRQELVHDGFDPADPFNSYRSGDPSAPRRANAADDLPPLARPYNERRARDEKPRHRSRPGFYARPRDLYRWDEVVSVDYALDSLRSVQRPTPLDGRVWTHPSNPPSHAPAQARTAFAPPVLSRRTQSVQFVRLHRPNALNALNEETTETLRALFEKWDSHTITTQAVVWEASPESFCAGTDLSALRKAASAPFAPLVSLARLARQLARQRTLTVPVFHGVSMGAGAALGLQCKAARIATEYAAMAVPDVRAGLVPQAGVLHALAQLPHAGFGLFLALTGFRVHGFDCVHAGLATHAVSYDALPALWDALRLSGDPSHALWALSSHAEDPALLPPFTYAHRGRLAYIAARFGDEARDLKATLEGVRAAAGSEWTRRVVDAIDSQASPVAVALTFELMRRARAGASLEDLLRWEVRANARLVAESPDFALAARRHVDKETALPKAWAYASPEDVPRSVLDALLAPLPNPELEERLQFAEMPRSGKDVLYGGLQLADAVAEHRVYARRLHERPVPEELAQRGAAITGLEWDSWVLQTLLEDLLDSPSHTMTVPKNFIQRLDSKNVPSNFPTSISSEEKISEGNGTEVVAKLGGAEVRSDRDLQKFVDSAKDMAYAQALKDKAASLDPRPVEVLAADRLERLPVVAMQREWALQSAPAYQKDAAEWRMRTAALPADVQALLARPSQAAALNLRLAAEARGEALAPLRLDVLRCVASLEREAVLRADYARALSQGRVADADSALKALLEEVGREVEAVDPSWRSLLDLRKSLAEHLALAAAAPRTLALAKTAAANAGPSPAASFRSKASRLSSPKVSADGRPVFPSSNSGFSIPSSSSSNGNSNSSPPRWKPFSKK